MRGFFLLIMISLPFKVLHCQNLIPNYSFENADCPQSYSRKASDFRVSSWEAADEGTPDYYNTCTDVDVGIPYNWAGGQYPVDGEGYVGIYLKKGKKYQENLVIELLNPLEKGRMYNGHFSVANSAYAEFLGCEISLFLSPKKQSIKLTENYEFQQIILPISPPKSLDDYQWRRLSFSYLAEGGERYLHVGSLKNPLDHCRKNISRVKNEVMLNNASYVYIDNFFLGLDSSNSEIDVPQFELKKEIIPVRITYEFNQSEIVAPFFLQLDSLAEAVCKEDLQLLITGSTDSLGTDSYNKELGLKRALAVKEYLVFAGVPQSKVDVKTKGEQTPQYPNHSEEYRSMNRSALIEFFVKKKSD